MIKLPILPSMQCDDDCGECCGVVLITPNDYYRIKSYIKRHNIKPILQRDNHGQLYCPFYQEDKCAIHQVRPFICQAFGHSPKLNCPRGYNNNIKDEIIRKTVRKLGSHSIAMHRFISAEEEINAKFELFKTVSELKERI